MGEFFKDPLSCLTLASYLITNTGMYHHHPLGLHVLENNKDVLKPHIAPNHSITNSSATCVNNTPLFAVFTGILFSR